MIAIPTRSRLSHNQLLCCAVGLAAAACFLAGCSCFTGDQSASRSIPERALAALEQVRTRQAPDAHLRVFTVGLERSGRGLVATGEVDNAEARADTLRALAQAGFTVADRIEVLPDPALKCEWAISTLSVANAREQPEHKAELGTQIPMGHAVRLWQQRRNKWLEWYLAESADGYHAWVEKGTVAPCTGEGLKAWNNGPLLIVTALEERILVAPRAEAEPVSDVVVADLVKRLAISGDWYEVALPDGRTGFLPKKAAEDYAQWKARRKPTADSLEADARRLLGRPYLWGGNSPKGLDCSGFTKLVFYLNGIELKRNASQQATQGASVPLDANFSRLRKGDLVFFGHRGSGSKPARIAHVGLYLGNKLFIHSAERVRISSLDPASPLADVDRLFNVLCARRLLPDGN